MNPNYSPFDHYLHLSKQAADALVPGQVGAGANPGTTGMLDSDPMQATNTDIALQRYAMNQAPILANTDADGGAGYSHPAPGTSPSLQMHADVKAAAVIQEAEAFAEYCYTMNKQAARGQHTINNAQWAAQQAQAQQGGNFMGNVGHGFNQAMAGAGHHANQAMEAAGQFMGQVGGHMQAGAQVAQEGMAQATGQAGHAIQQGAQYVNQGSQNAVRRGAAYARQHPQAAMAIGAGAVAGSAALGGLAANRMMQMQAAEAQLAGGQKQASFVDEAAEAGRRFALSQIASGNF